MSDGVSVILIRKEDRAILMQHRSNDPDIYFPDSWCYPGGRVEEEDEGDFEKAARRELYEETGYQAKDFYLLNEFDFTTPDGKIRKQHTFVVIYDGKQKITKGEGQEMQFLTLEELKTKKIVPGVDEICSAAIEYATKNGLIDEKKREGEKIKLC
jgi:mutator protein MutT